MGPWLLGSYSGLAPGGRCGALLPMAQAGVRRRATLVVAIQLGPDPQRC